MKQLSAILFFITACFVVLSPVSVFAQASIGSYHYSDETAVVLFASFYSMGASAGNDRELLRLDFKSKNMDIIAKGSDIAWNRVNQNGTRVAYLKGGELKIYDFDKKEAVPLFGGSITGQYFQWTGNPAVLAGINARTNAWYALNLKEEIYQEAKYEGQYLWGAAWSSSCVCVEFEVSDESHTSHYLLRMTKDGVNKVEGRRYLGHSPDGRYTAYGKGSEYDDWYNEFTVIDNEKSTQSTFNATYPISYERMLWGKHVLRVLTSVALLDLKTMQTVYPSSIWKDQRPKVGRVPIDIAADPAGYVLRWDMEKKQFLVEDINAGGNIIKMYEKFWDTDASDVQEEGGAKKP